MGEEKKTVRVDFFIADVANVEIPITDELLENMMDKAVQYLSMGNFDWKSYSLMSDLTRFIFQQAAGKIHEREHALNHDQK